MTRMGNDGRAAHGVRTDVVAIVTGGSSEIGRDVASGLTGWGWAIVIVYLEHQPVAEATVAKILAAEGKVVAVRADLADELDVERLFAESSLAFAGVDVIAHTTTDRASILYQHAARHLRSPGAIVSVLAAERITPGIASELRQRGISVGRAPPEEVLSFLDMWRQQTTG